MPSRLYRQIALLLLALHLGACATWRPSGVAPRELIQQERPRLIRVFGDDRVARVVRDPRIEDDAIVVDAECRRSPNPRGGYICPTESVVALEDVRQIDVRRVDVGRSAFLLLTIGTFVGAFVFVAGWDSGPMYLGW